MTFPAADNLFDAFQAKRPFVADHCYRVSVYAVRLANQYGLSADAIETIRVGALLHDVGKLLIPLGVLNKPGRLREREWLELKSHPDMGVELAERSGMSPEICEIVLHHHERYDGTGYPDRLRGNQVMWPVRIVSVMDSFDALTSPREYRKALHPEEARALIAREAGMRFCPWIVSGLLSLPLSFLQPPAADMPSQYFADGVPPPAALTATEAWTATMAGL
jgi:putative nucleotidyltransferase with HDIG domain